MISPWMLLACTSYHSQVRPLPPGHASITPATKPRPEEDCQWVVVEEFGTTKLMGLTVGRSARPFTEQLFYCCPSETGMAPKCHGTTWLQLQPTGAGAP